MTHDVKRFRRSLCQFGTTAALFASILPLASYAAPQGGEVSGGSGAISQTPDQQQTTVYQDSQRMQVDWQSFDVAAGESVDFLQPSSSAVVLNLIHDIKPSEINGRITANGNVFLSNGNGLFFGKGAEVNVGGLLATGLIMDAGQFMQGHYDLSGGGGKVLNQGSIQADNSVSLVAPQVENQGIITAHYGRVNLVAGERASIDFSGDGLMLFELPTDAVAIDSARIDNSGSIQADGGRVVMSAAQANNVLDSVINQDGLVQAGRIEEVGGEIFLSAGTINSNGLIRADGAGGDAGSVMMESAGRTTLSGQSEVSASSVQQGQGGDIHILGDELVLEGDSHIAADGVDGGGTVLLGGDYQGSNPQITNADNTWIGSGVMVSANALQQGDGGEIIVWSDNTTQYYGHASAQGGALGGDGGFIEVSGKYLGFNGTVDLSAIEGNSGLLLLDPANITITTPESGTVATALADNIYQFTEDSGLDVNIDPATIVTILDVGTDVTLQATNSITVTDAITSTGTGGLTLEATTIDINSPVTVGGDIQLLATNVYGDNVVTTADVITTATLIIEADLVGTGGGEKALGFQDASALLLSNTGIGAWDLVEIGTSSSVGSTSITVSDATSGNLSVDYLGADILSINEGHAFQTTTLSGHTDFSYTATSGSISTGGGKIVNLGAANAVFTTSANNASISLPSLSVGANLSLSTTGASGHVTLDNGITNVALGTVGVGGNLDITTGGTIAQGSAITVGGNTTLTTDVSDKSISLSQPGNSFGGSLSVNTQGTTGHVNVDADSSTIDLAASSVGGNLTLDTSAGLSNSGAVSVTGNTDITVGAGQSLLLDDVGNSFTGTLTLAPVSGQIVNLSVTDSTAIQLAGVDITGDLTLTSGDIISQGAAWLVDGAASLTTTGNDKTITLENTSNSFAGLQTTTAGSAGHVSVNNGSTAIDLGTSSIAGDLTLRTTSGFANSGDISVSGNTDIQVGSGQSIILDTIGSGNTLSGNLLFSASSGNLQNLTVHDLNAVSLPAMTLSGNLEIVSGASFSQTGTLNISGSTSITVANGSDLLLSDPDNVFSGGLSLAASTGQINNLSISSASDLSLSNVDITGNLIVSTLGNISQGTALLVDGSAAFTAADGGTIIIGNTGNNFGGNVGFASQGGAALSQVTVADSSALALGNVNAANLAVTSGGAIGQQGGTSLLVSSQADFNVTSADQTISLNNTGNALAAVRFSTLGTTGHVSLDNGGTAINLGTSTVNGNLTLRTTAGFSNSGDVTVSGTTDIQVGNGQSISLGKITNGNTLSGALSLSSSGTLNNLTVHNTTDITLAALTLSGNLDLQSGASVTQTGAWNIGGSSSITVAGGSNLLLDNSSNQFSGGLTFAASSGQINDLTLAATGDIVLAAMDITGNLAVTAKAGNISQSGGVLVDGGATLTADKGKDITLSDSANAITGSVDFVGNGGALANVSFTNTQAVDLGDVNVSNNLTVVSSGNITQQAATSLMVGGVGDFTTTGSDNTVALTNTTNDISTAQFNTSGTQGDVDFHNGTRRIILGDSAVQGNLNVTTDANVSGSGLPAVSNSGDVAVSGDLSVTVLDDTESIRLNTQGTGNAIGGLTSLASSDLNTGVGAVTLHNNMDVTLQSEAINGNLTVVSGGNFNQSGALDVSGITDITVADGGNIMLDDAGNRLNGRVYFYASTGKINDLTVYDTTYIDLEKADLSGSLVVDTSAGTLADIAVGLINTQGSGGITLNASGYVYNYDSVTSNGAPINLTTPDYAYIYDVVDAGGGTITVDYANVYFGSSGIFSTPGGRIVFIDSAGNGLEIGDASGVLPNASNISASTFTNFVADTIEMDTTGSIIVNNIDFTSGGATSTSAIVLTAGGYIEFLGNPSTFYALEARADDGITVGVDVVTVSGGITLNGDNNNLPDTRDNIILADGIVLDSNQDISLSAKTAGIVLEGDMGISATNSDILINDVINGAFALTLNSGTGNINVNGIGSSDPLTGLTVTSSGTSNFAGDIITAGNVNLSAAENIELVQDTSIDTSAGDGTIFLDGANVDGEFALNLIAGAGTIELGSIGATTSLTALQLQTDGKLTMAGDIYVNGSAGMDLSGVATAELLNDVRLDTTASNGPIDVRTGAIDGNFNLTLAAGSANVDIGAVGVNTSLAGLIVITSGQTRLYGNINTQGSGALDMSQATDIDLFADVTITSLATAGTIQLANSTVDGNYLLTIDAGGGTVETASLGSNIPLAGYVVSGKNGTMQGEVVTQGATGIDLSSLQYPILAGDLLLDSSLGDGPVNLNGTLVAGIYNLTINAGAGNVDLGAVSENNPLSSLSISSQGTTNLGGTLITQGSGGIDLSDALLVNMTAATVFDSSQGNGPVLLNGGSLDGTFDVEVLAGSGEVALADTGINAPLNTLLVSTSGTLSLEGDVVVDGLEGLDLSQTQDVVLLRNSTLSSSSGEGYFNLQGSNIHGPYTLTLNTGAGDIDLGGVGIDDPVNSLVVVTAGELNLQDAIYTKGSGGVDMTAVAKVVLNADSTIDTSAGNGNIDFTDSQIDGAFNLDLASGDGTVNLPVVGGRTAVNGIRVSNLGVTNLLGNITSVGDGGINLAGASQVNLIQDTTLKSSGTGVIDLSGGAVDGEFALLLNSGSGGVMLADMGQTLALTRLQVQSEGGSGLGGHIRVSGENGIDFSAATSIDLFADSTLDTTPGTGPIDISGAPVNGPYTLTLLTNGTSVTVDSVGSQEALAGFTVNTGGDSVETAGALELLGEVLVSGDLSLDAGAITQQGNMSSSGGNIQVVGADFLQQGDISTAGGAIDVNANSIEQRGNVGSGGGTVVYSALGTITMGADTITTSQGGDIQYTTQTESILIGQLDAGTGVVVLDAGAGTAVLSNTGRGFELTDPYANVIANEMTILSGDKVGASLLDPITVDIPQDSRITVDSDGKWVYLNNINGALINNLGKATVLDGLSVGFESTGKGVAVNNGYDGDGSAPGYYGDGNAPLNSLIAVADPVARDSDPTPGWNNRSLVPEVPTLFRLLDGSWEFRRAKRSRAETGEEPGIDTIEWF